LEKVISGATNKEVDKVLKEIKEVTKKAESISKGSGGTNLKDAVDPLLEAVKDVKKLAEAGKKSREAIYKKVGSVQEDIEDAASVISGAAKNAARSSHVKDAEKEVAGDIKAMKAHAVKGINKVGKVVVKNQKYMKAIYKDIHH